MANLSKPKMNYKYLTLENKEFNKDLIKIFGSTYEFCEGDINNFYLMLRKGVYPYEYMDIWKRFDERLLPDKEGFYSSVNITDITVASSRHAK